MVYRQNAPSCDPLNTMFPLFQVKMKICEVKWDFFNRTVPIILGRNEDL